MSPPCGPTPSTVYSAGSSEAGQVKQSQSWLRLLLFRNDRDVSTAAATAAHRSACARRRRPHTMRARRTRARSTFRRSCCRRRNLRRFRRSRRSVASSSAPP